VVGDVDPHRVERGAGLVVAHPQARPRPSTRACAASSGLIASPEALVILELGDDDRAGARRGKPPGQRGADPAPPVTAAWAPSSSM
jgi:hypothetical protein